MWVCDNTVLPSRHRCNGSPKPAGTEICNGLDDDCDGKVDELDSASNRTSDDKLIYLSGPKVTMFAYEATRYDAKTTDSGFDSTRRPCSVPGRLPWSNVTKDEAEAACERSERAGGCARPPSGWMPATAQATPPSRTGNNFAAQSCNGWDYTKAAGVATLVTGAATLCKSDPNTTVAGNELTT